MSDDDTTDNALKAEHIAGNMSICQTSCTWRTQRPRSSSRPVGSRIHLTGWLGMPLYVLPSVLVTIGGRKRPSGVLRGSTNKGRIR